eukprot:m.142504 g.142504  ORF g.142504 m.142504 type:complete len:1028 (-) comp14879_c0_seq4:265-3348(-)
MANKREEAIKVFTRVRPPLPREISNRTQFKSCIGVLGKDIYVSTKDEPILVKRVENGVKVSGNAKSFRFENIIDSDTNNATMYDKCCSRLVRDCVLNGENGSIMAYGQTGSGKTHTLLGHGATFPNSEQGVAALALEDILTLTQEQDFETNVRASCIQIYRNYATDLLVHDSKDVSKKISARAIENAETGITTLCVKDIEDITNMLSLAGKRRKVANTMLNSTSSRSHLILTLFVSITSKDKIRRQCKIHIIDLAGSERVKDSGVEGENLKDAASINLSLFHLIVVVKALIRKDSYIPYKDSLLTTVIKDSLGGNAKSMLIATLSPAQVHWQESVSTLAFASSCSLITQHTIITSSVDEPKQVNKTKQEQVKAPWQHVQLGDSLCPGGREMVHTLSCLMYGNNNNPLVLLLHGHPSEASANKWLIPALVTSGYLVVACDMPGRGHSQGTPLKTRSEFNLVPGGAADLVCELIRKLKGKKGKAVIFGYDWGAGIALSCALSRPHRRHVGKIIAFHPSYNEQVKGELSQISVPTMVVWCKQDQFHSWSKWKKCAEALRASLGDDRFTLLVVDESQWGKYGWSRHTTRITAEVVKFITGVDPFVVPEKVFKCSESDEVATDGKAVKRLNNVVVVEAEKLKTSEVEAGLFTTQTPEQEAVTRLKEIVRAGRLQSYYSAYMAGDGTALQREATALFGALPILSDNIPTPDVLVKLGLWESVPRNWNAMKSSPRYFVGRQVLVRARVHNIPGHNQYMKISPSSSCDELVTHKAVITSINQDTQTCTVDVEHCARGSVGQAVSLHDISLLNQPHVFAKNKLGHVVFEDGLHCKYPSPLLRAKLCEIALKLSPIASQLDYDNVEECTLLQKKAIITIRHQLNLTTFQRSNHGVSTEKSERSRDRRRYCGDDVARFACYGQGHCHTVSSTMAAVTNVFARFLGIDLKYRGGQSIHALHPVSDSPETHQWLEMTLRPLCATVSCDLYRQDACSESDVHLARDIQHSYERDVYPNGALLSFSGHKVTTLPLSHSDVQA